MDPKTIVVMEGDQTGQELLEEALRVLDPAVTGLDVVFARYDLSLENRRATERGGARGGGGHERDRVRYQGRDRYARGPWRRGFTQRDPA